MAKRKKVKAGLPQQGTSKSATRIFNLSILGFFLVVGGYFGYQALQDVGIHDLSVIGSGKSVVVQAHDPT